MQDSKFFLNLNLLIAFIIILLILFFELNYFKSKTVIKKIYNPKAELVSKENFEFILNNENKIIEKINKIEQKNYLYFYKRFKKNNLEPQTFYIKKISNNPESFIFTKNIISDKLSDVIIIKINKIYNTTKVNFFQRSESLESHIVDLFYKDDKYEYYIFFSNDFNLTHDTNINIFHHNDSKIFFYGAEFYYIDYDKPKLKKVKSIINNVKYNNFSIIVSDEKLTKNPDLKIYNFFSFFYFLINLYAYVKFNDKVYLVLLLSTLNFFVSTFFYNINIDLLLSSLLSFSLYLITFKTKIYDNFFILLTIIFSIFLLHYSTLNLFIINLIVSTISLFFFHKIINYIFENKI